jgi:hypothetical protein
MWPMEVLADTSLALPSAALRFFFDDFTKEFYNIVEVNEVNQRQIELCEVM